MSTSSAIVSRAACCALLACLVLLVYWQVGGHQFVHFDDMDYIVHNAAVRSGLTWEGLAAAFRMDSAHSYWHPLTWLSLMAGVELFGDSPAAVVGINVALHWATACLLCLFLARATGRGRASLVAACLFALHPLNVESVAWAVERKTVLMGFFSLLAVQFHLLQARRPGPLPMLGTALCFALALLSKVAAVSLPVMLLALDVWPLRRLERGPGHASPARLVLEKLPLFCLALGAAALAVLSRQDVTAGGQDAARSLGLRVANFAVSLARYLEKAAWPQDLSVYYPFPGSVPAWQWLGAAALAVAVTVLGVLAWRAGRPYVLAGWLWFLAGLLPASGLVQTGLWPAMADRFAYLPLMGLCWTVAFGLGDVLRGRGRVLMEGLLCAYLALFSWAQVGVWHDGAALFGRAQELYPDDPVVNQQFGYALYRQGWLEEAERVFAHCAALVPGDRDALKMTALVRQRLGDVRGAEAVLRGMLARDPQFVDAVMLLGSLLLERGAVPEGLAQLRRAAALDPESGVVQYNLGQGLLRGGDPAGAERALRRALAERPGDPTVLTAFGRALAALGRAEEAADSLSRALELEPNSADAHEALAEALTALGRERDAREHGQAARDIRRRDAQAFAALGEGLAASGRLADAEAAFRQALDLQPGHPQALRGLERARAAKAARK